MNYARASTGFRNPIETPAVLKLRNRVQRALDTSI